MRIISGRYKGKNIMGFDVLGTRPTMDRVKESIFSMIQNYLKDSICLDLFAGSGSLGIEALSNGASECYFVENSSEIYPILEKNLLGIDNYSLMKKDFRDALDFFVRNNVVFDVIFLDPPYKMNLINGILDFICKNHILRANGIVVCEFEFEPVLCNCLELIKSREYGSKKVYIYKLI